MKYNLYAEKYIRRICTASSWWRQTPVSKSLKPRTKAKHPEAPCALLQPWCFLSSWQHHHPNTENIICFYLVIILPLRHVSLHNTLQLFCFWTSHMNRSFCVFLPPSLSLVSVRESFRLLTIGSLVCWLSRLFSIHLFNKYTGSTYHVPNVVPGAWDASVNKTG